ncbi:MAG: ECF transporter S component [Oscillospiraceae bacterium]|nr:ECF transporter S component [Oscillospiraceae bacterium]
MIKKRINKTALGAMFLAVGIVLPFFTGQIPQIGSMLLPMHIPVFLCGLICGGRYGAAVGFIMPLMRSFLFGMPPIFPTAIAMAFELSAYGFIVGFAYEKARWHCIKSLYRCMIAAMLGGRAIWGIVMLVLLGIGTEGFTAAAFISGAFLNAVPGIILQFIMIPGIMLALDKTHLVPFGKNEKAKFYKNATD